MKNEIVSIAKVTGSIGSALTEVLTPFGGLSSMVHKGDLILIKPNFVAPRTNETGATTDLELIKCVAQQVHQCGGRPILFEVPAIEQRLEIVYEVLKIREFAKNNEIEIYSRYDDIVKLKVPDSRRKLKVPEVVQRTKIINIPKLKTHVIATFSAAMKNLFGFLPESERRKMHMLGIHQAIFDLNKLIKPILNIVDATTCMEGDGPVYGDKVTLNLLVAGTDTAAVDKVCCQLVGIDTKDIGYLKLARQEGGRVEANICGESLDFPVAAFRRPRPTAVYKLWTRLSFALDAIWVRITGKTLTGILYSAGVMGTRPFFDWSLCNQCEECLKVCPVKGALNIQSRSIDYSHCIRCLNCFFVCTLDAISVKGLTKPQ